jgi:hypothetical protein
VASRREWANDPARSPGLRERHLELCAGSLGLSGEVAEEAAERVESGEGTVPVVCTPSGGEQSVRVELPKGWEDRMSDEDLLAAIAATRE